ncbi:MAG: hypothetical protein QNI87_08430 [Erythrobacter sp.]|uniref:hypothetical protein n=1 Tax=Erythrobacter sp. TaxID=1042 RepID=UPI0026023326|nr:hypothetical protein [Erythrobacter sp.]MDJ0978550.1 hypothetical protein [Erythrobacter sp.]
MRLPLAYAAGLALTALGAASASAATKTTDGVDLAAERAAIGQFQDLDQRLQDIGWRLVRGNAPFCETVLPSIGLQLQDTASYGRPDIAKAALGLKGAFAVQTAAAQSPSARSGAFPRNREIVRLGETDPNGWPAGERMDWERLTKAHDWIDQALARGASLAFTFSNGAVERVEPVPVCATRFELLSDSKTAVADGSRVVIGTRFAAFGWDEDEEFAGVLAHELAHNLLSHRVWLERNKRTRRHIRLTEREADRLMPWLLANAGYEPEAAARFMERWGRKHGRTILTRSLAYEGWDERAERIAREAALVRTLMEREGEADWSVHFRREIDPAKGLAVAARE